MCQQSEGCVNIVLIDLVNMGPLTQRIVVARPLIVVVGIIIVAITIDHDGPTTRLRIFPLPLLRAALTASTLHVYPKMRRHSLLCVCIAVRTYTILFQRDLSTLSHQTDDEENVNRVTKCTLVTNRRGDRHHFAYHASIRSWLKIR